MKIGVISDNHGHVNPNVYPIFEGVELILHAGDIGEEDVITSLEAIAPVKAIHGNVDTFPLSTRYPQALALEIHGVVICMVHHFIHLKHSLIRNALRDIGKEQVDILIHGHSHQAKLERLESTLLFNPGSAGKRRFSLRPAVGLLTIFENGKFVPEIVYLDDKKSP